MKFGRKEFDTFIMKSEIILMLKYKHPPKCIEITNGTEYVVLILEWHFRDVLVELGLFICSNHVAVVQLCLIF